MLNEMVPLAVVMEVSVTVWRGRGREGGKEEREGGRK